MSVDSIIQQIEDLKTTYEATQVISKAIAYRSYMNFRVCSVTKMIDELEGITDVRTRLTVIEHFLANTVDRELEARDND